MFENKRKQKHLGNDPVLTESIIKVEEVELYGANLQIDTEWCVPFSVIKIC